MGWTNEGRAVPRSANQSPAHSNLLISQLTIELLIYSELFTARCITFAPGRLLWRKLYCNIPTKFLDKDRSYTEIGSVPPDWPCDDLLWMLISVILSIQQWVLNTGLWLVNTGHVTSILSSHCSVKLTITWQIMRNYELHQKSGCILQW